MSAIIAGNLQRVNFMLTDAFVTKHDDTRSYRDCQLADKIYELYYLKLYVSIVGDSNILSGIHGIECWSKYKNNMLNLFNAEDFQHVLRAAEKFKFASDKKKDNNNLTTHKTTHAYLMNRENIKCYEIERINNSTYEIKNEGFIRDNLTFINYGGRIKRLSSNFEIPPAQLYKQAVSELKKFDKKSKSEGFGLNYDFQDRFCCIILDKNSEEIREYIPYNFLTDTMCGDPTDWELVENKKYQWSPF